jgi:site-specific DNA recombinase
VVGVAEDLDVSAGSTTPFDRPVGDWLTNRLGEFDVLVFFRADRIVRRLFDLADLIRWARDHSVTLVSATESYFDLSSDLTQFLPARRPKPRPGLPKCIERSQLCVYL